MSDFSFSLTDEEKSYLKDLVRWSIQQGLDDKGPENPPAPPTDKLSLELGAFVTLKLHGQLRGCIGHIVGDKPLYTTVAEMAQAAAFQDPRFPPISRDEFKDLELEISILSPLYPLMNRTGITPGRHGLLVMKGGRSGLLLPQVATEYGWDAETFLRRTCEKAGLHPDTAEDPYLQVFAFEAEVF